MITRLVSVALKNPRAAAIAVLILVSGFLGYTVKFLFFESKTAQTAVNTNLTSQISELKVSVATLRHDRDSLITLNGDIKADGLRKEIAALTKSSSDLQDFNEKLQKQKTDLDQKFKDLQQTATRNRVVSETLKQKSNETN